MATDDTIKEEISFMEGFQYGSLALSILSMAAYVGIITTRVLTDHVPVTEVAWRGPLLLVVAISGGLYGLGYAVARRRHHGTVEDARDKEIQRYGESINGGLVGLTVAASIVMLALNVEPFWVVHTLYCGSWFASFVSTAGRVAAYREGIPS